MARLFKNSDGHFDAEIDIYPIEKTGRKSHPLNGIRWAFAYAEDFAKNTKNGTPTQISDVWPEFLDESGQTIPTDVPLMGMLKARMHIVSPEMVSVHMTRLKVGTKFYCLDGIRPRAQGVVTALD
ncbi:MAG: hypothetical protein GXP04_12920 [Alphaproteobacteria bacterium]|nr:hypothetical protein [Alphaproteobacteria bacterium]